MNLEEYLRRVSGYAHVREHTRARLEGLGFSERNDPVAWRRLHNAYAHAYGAAYFSHQHGIHTGLAVSAWQEWTNNHDEDWFHDLYNDSFGIGIVYENPMLSMAAIDDIIIEGLFDGSLIVDPSTDPRVPSPTTIQNLSIDDVLRGTYGYGALTPASFADVAELHSLLLTDAANTTVLLIDAKLTLTNGDAAASIEISELAALFGSTLGRQLAGDNLILGTLAGSLLGTISLNVGQAIGAGAIGALGAITSSTDASGVWSDFNNELATFTASAAIGATSSWLALELGEALGLEGFGAEMFSTGVGALLEHTLNNLIANENIFTFIKPQAAWFDSGGLTGAGGLAIANAFASFFAAKLGALIVQPQTQAAVVLSSLGTAAGGYIGSLKLASIFSRIGMLAGPLGTFVGALIGFVLGAFIGNLFGSKKPKIPTANAEVLLQIPSAEYALGAIYQNNGGGRDFVRSMGLAARDTLNGLIEVVTRGDGDAKVSNTGTLTQVYGHTGQQVWVRLGGGTSTFFGGPGGGTLVNVTSADEAVDKGVLWALPQTQIIGGDLFLKRALYNMVRHAGQVTNVAQLLGDLQIADDYAFYLENRAIIDAVIAEPWTSMSQAQKDFYSANEAFMTRPANRSPGRAQPDPRDNDASRLFPVARAA